MPVNEHHLSDTGHHLISGCIAGDRACQAKLYDLYACKMLGVCLRYSKSREEAEEILHEGFLRVFRYINKFEGKGSFGGWIRAIMINCALLRYRNNAHLNPVVRIDITRHDIAIESEILSNLHVKEMLSLVQSLPPRYRMVFNLFVFEGYKHKEIAEALGITEGTSKSNLSDARAILQKALTVKKKLAYYKP